MAVLEQSMYCAVLTIVTAGDIPRDGHAIKGDDFYAFGHRLGTVMKVVAMPGGLTIHYLAGGH